MPHIYVYVCILMLVLHSLAQAAGPLNKKPAAAAGPLNRKKKPAMVKKAFGNHREDISTAVATALNMYISMR